MQNAEMRIKLGTMIRKAARSARVRQIQLAQELGISASAVSQMISGKMTPSMGQLDAMLRLLRPDRMTEAEMRNCLTGVRVGGKSVRSPLNQRLRAARKQCGLSFAELAEKTGIKPTELRAMENRAGMYPNVTEAARLAAVLGKKLEDFWQGSPFEWNTPRPSAHPTIMQLADGQEHGSLAIFRMPLLEFFILNYYEPDQMDVAAFLQQFGGNLTMETSEPGTVAVVIPGANLGLADAQTVRLVTAPLEAPAEGMLVIGRDHAGKVRIGMLAGENVLPWLPTARPVEAFNSWQWAWPVRMLNMEYCTAPMGMLRD